jgi:hypothetical protein
MSNGTSTLDTDDAPQSAMLLTDAEWQDLSEMMAHYRDATEWVAERDRHLDHSQPTYIAIQRKRALAKRIIEAAT